MFPLLRCTKGRFLVPKPMTPPFPGAIPVTMEDGETLWFNDLAQGKRWFAHRRPEDRPRHASEIYGTPEWEAAQAMDTPEDHAYLVETPCRHCGENVPSVSSGPEAISVLCEDCMEFA